MGYLLLVPVRRLLENPWRILGPHIREGMTVLEPGSGMGYFTLPAARLAGRDGRVIAVDVEKRMLHGLRRRALRAGLDERITTWVCLEDDLGIGSLDGRVDLAIAIHVVHEAPDPAKFLEQVHRALRPGGRLLLAEPPSHVPPQRFRRIVADAERTGFEVLAPPRRPSRQAALLVKELTPGTWPSGVLCRR